MQKVKIYGREHVLDIDGRDFEPAEELYVPSRHKSVQFELSRRRGEVLLKHLR